MNIIEAEFLPFKKQSGKDPSAQDVFYQIYNDKATPPNISLNGATDDDNDNAEPFAKEIHDIIRKVNVKNKPTSASSARTTFSTIFLFQVTDTEDDGPFKCSIVYRNIPIPLKTIKIDNENKIYLCITPKYLLEKIPKDKYLFQNFIYSYNGKVLQDRSSQSMYERVDGKAEKDIHDRFIKQEYLNANILK